MGQPQDLRQQSLPFSRLTSSILMIAGFLWLGWLLVRDSTDLLAMLRDADWNWLTVSLILGSLSIFLNTPVFYMLLREQHGLVEKPSFPYAMSLFFIGQVIRHLPGRFWGMAYQINRSRFQIYPLTLIKVNLDLMLIHLNLQVFSSLIILLSYILENIVIGFIAFLVWSIFFISSLRLNWAYAFLRILKYFIPENISNRLNNHIPEKISNYSWSVVVRIWFVMVVSRVAYLLAWQTFPHVFSDLAMEKMIVLCATYSLAWVVGFLSMITPAGLGIREVVFISLSGDMLSVSNTAFLALFVRAWLLVIDFLMVFLVFLLTGREIFKSK